jgi:hypothetical protein
LRALLASIAFGALSYLVLGGFVSAQNPPVPAPTGPVNPPAPTPSPTPVEGAPSPTAFPSLAPTPPPATPTPTPTPVPIGADPPSLAVSPGGTETLHVSGVYGTLSAKIGDETLATINGIDQNAHSLVVAGIAPGTTFITLSDDRGMTHDVPIRVAYLAGSIASDVNVRLTGNPASLRFLRNMAAQAASDAAQLRPGATVAVDPASVQGARDLPVSDLLSVDVPLQLNGTDYFSVLGTTHVHFENVALPHIRPSRLMVSDYPEQLRENGVLFTATLDRTAPQRFLYYHYNPADQPARRILLRAANTSSQPATLQFISGEAGPSANEMDVGHTSTVRFLVREAQNEGSVVVIPPNSTATLVNQTLAPQSSVSNLLQLRELDGDPVALTLLAQNATDPLDRPVDSAQLLESETKHARGVYRVPEFYFDYVYHVDSGDDLEIPIGQLPLPNLREGQALAGDYGVMQSISLTIVNPTAGQAAIAIYENPRGGRATGTYLIDRTLVQSHAAAAFSKWKLHEYRVPAHSTFRVSIVTMPEGGSSYPVRLIVAPDDGGASPGSPGSPVY